MGAEKTWNPFARRVVQEHFHLYRSAVQMFYGKLLFDIKEIYLLHESTEQKEVHHK